MSKESMQVNGYLATIKRLESDISMCDRDATLTSIAISLKRIADALTTTDRYGATGSEAICYAIRDAIRDARP